MPGFTNPDLYEDTLTFDFTGQVHPSARLVVRFTRTSRIPDGGSPHLTPRYLGSFALRSVDGCPGPLPDPWRQHGGILLPVLANEALRLDFEPETLGESAIGYPFAVRVAAGKVNALTGGDWEKGEDLRQDPPDYLVVPGQGSLDGFCVGAGVVRQFVATPLGDGRTAEEQITGGAEHGGLQIQVYPMRAEAFVSRIHREGRLSRLHHLHAPDHGGGGLHRQMGLGAGGRLQQTVVRDPYAARDWEARSGRCFVHLLDARDWRLATGEHAPQLSQPLWEQAEAGWPEAADAPHGENPSEAIESLEGSPALTGLRGVVAPPAEN